MDRYWVAYSEVADFDAHTLNKSLTVEKDGQTILTLDAHVTDTIQEPISITTLTYAAPITGAAVATAEVLAGKIFGQVDGRTFGPVALRPEHAPDSIFTDGMPAITLSMPATTARVLRCLGRTLAKQATLCRPAGQALSPIVFGAVTRVDAGHRVSTRETSGCYRCKDGCSAGITTAAASCCMATAPLSCLWCNGNAVAAYSACIHGCQEGRIPNADNGC
jgi:hypothetical protein